MTHNIQCIESLKSSSERLHHSIQVVRSYELHTVAEHYVPFIIDVAEFYRTRSVFFLYAESIKAMEMSTMVFKLTRALSREGFRTLNLYFSELHESSSYVRQVVRPLYIAVISDYKAIDEFSLAVSTYDVSFPAWLVMFVYVGHRSEYCHNPPGNIFHLRFDTRMLVRCYKENVLREWYSLDGKRTEIDDVATWSVEKGIAMIAPPILHDRRYNLRGLIMKAVIVKDGPFIMLDENGELDGVYGKILRELCVTLNFTFEIVSKVDEYGVQNPQDGSWTGAVGELYAGRGDISISDFSMTSARLNVVDFTLPLLLSKCSIYIKEPNIIAVNWSSYFLAFGPSLWFIILGVIIASTILVTFLKVTNRMERNIKTSLHDSFLEVWGIFCQQGIIDFPSRSSLRIAYLSLFLLTVIVSAAYSAALISFLTSDILVLPFNSLEEFVQDGTYQFAVFRGTADYNIFMNSKDPLAKKLMTLMMKENDLPLNLIEGFQRVCKNPKLALYTSDEIKKSISFGIPCKVATIYAGRIDSLAMILSKNNPFTDLINFHLQKFVNNGMMNRLKDETFKKQLHKVVKHHPASSVFLFYTAATGDFKFSMTIKTWLRSLSRERIPVLGIHLSNVYEITCYRYRITRPLFVVVLFDDESVLEFSKVSRNFSMSFPAWYVIFFPGNYRRDYCHEKSGNLFNVRFDTEMLVMCPPDRVMREWYYLSNNKTETFDLATWEPSGVITFLTNLTLYERRRDMKGLALRTVVVKDGPFISVDENGKMSGIFGEVITEITQAANFTLKFEKSVKEYGRWDERRKLWTGAIGEIVAGRADISISEFSLTNPRLDVIDYTLPIIVTSMRFYIKDPLYNGVKWNGYFKVFDLKIWLFIIFIITIAPFLVSLLKMNELREGETHRIVSIIIENYLQFWGIFCQQGLTGIPYRLSLRLAYFSTFLSAFVVFAAYSGALVSFLANTIRILPFQSFEELVNDGTYKLAVYKDTSDYDMFAYANDTLSKKIMKIMKKEKDLPSTTLEGISQVCNEHKVTFLTTVEIWMSLKDYKLCKMVTIKSGQISSLAMILTKNNPFTNLINHHMKNFLYNGVIDRLKTKNTRMMVRDELTFKTVSFQAVKPIFDLLQIGFILSICILIMEKLYSYQKRNFNERRNARLRNNIEENVG
ncbi:hypothetical protein KPH14_005514 [Odynerus spinipes]|uniref:Uncharacterized protein n=1 Tax=Odynerus spinipes TaxID=1348599 RepID=A0AAD9VJH2_9HYME|nr:hypothetical protein KPH14_005514 [Odynerus spinipes]